MVVAPPPSRSTPHDAGASADVLRVTNLGVRVDKVPLLENVSFHVRRGTTLSIVGPNGAGKTTLFNLVTRVYKPDSGTVEFDGKSLLRTPPHRVVRRGIARTFQNVALFP